MKVFFRNLVKYRFLLRELIKKDIKLKYRSSILGVFWTLLEPLLTMFVLTIVFSNLLGKGDDNFPVYILCGRLLYGFFSASTKTALRSVKKNGSMISKVYIPKYMYPLASVISNYLIFLISLVVLVGVAVVEKVKPTLYLFQALIPLAIIVLLSMGVSLILSTCYVFFRDLEYLWSVALMLIMYTCAIFYKVESLKDSTNAWIFNFNPLYSVIVLFRDSVFGRSIAPDIYHLWYSLGFSVVTLLVGGVLFWRKQDQFILYV